MKVESCTAPSSSMRKLCPNLDREDGLDTVLEVPIPDEMFSSSGCGGRSSSKPSGTTTVCTNMMAWMRSHAGHHCASSALGRRTELQLMLGVIGAPLVPVPISAHHSILGCGVKEDPIEASMAKYIVQQYMAAVGGEKALNAISSMYAMGKVRMAASELQTVGGGGKKAAKWAGENGGSGEMGGFVLWQKRQDLWCLELVVSGCKISAGSDGKVAWRQTPWQQSHASRGPPRPLRRSLQGLDPRSTANLFAGAVCIGDKTINNHDCFVLRLDADASALRARSSSSVEIIRHTIWGNFSQRTGLLVHLEDSHLLRIKASSTESIYWETTMDSSIDDYRTVDGVSIAHAGRTAVSLFRFGETSEGHTRTRMEEEWTVEEVDFNIWGLSMDCFLPPGDIKEESPRGGEAVSAAAVKSTVGRSPAASVMSFRTGPSRIAAVNIEDSDDTNEVKKNERQL